MPKKKCDTVYNLDYSKLRGRIKEKLGTEKKLASALGRSDNFLTNVFKGRAYFSFADILKICEVCEIEDADIKAYFFTRSVTETARINE